VINLTFPQSLLINLSQPGHDCFITFIFGFVYSLLFFETGSCYAAQADLELAG
jgi:hypothetical protein